MKAIRVLRHGGVEALSLDDVPRPEPAPGEALVRIEAIGVNYIDIYQRSGAYLLEPPFRLGMEGAGVIEALGAGVESLQVGDRVAQAMELGAYAEFQAVPAASLVKLPPGCDSRSAAAAALQGMTAHYLVHDTFKLEQRHTALIHAGAGGVGRLLIQMAKRAGARVLTTVGSDAKAAVAADVGADEVIVYSRADFLTEVKRLTDGVGVDVVYDGVGKDTFERSLDCLRPRGLLTLFGAASGPVAPLNLQTLSDKGSLFLTRPNLGHYMQTRDELEQRSSDVFGWVVDGSLRLTIDRELPLAAAADAHRAPGGP